MRLRRLPALLAAAAVTWCALSPVLGSGTGPAGPAGTARSPRQEGSGPDPSRPPGPTGTGTGTDPVLAGTPRPEGTPGTTDSPGAAAPPATAPSDPDRPRNGTPAPAPGPSSGPGSASPATSPGGGGDRAATTEPPTATAAPSASDTASPTGTAPAEGSPDPHGWPQPHSTRPGPGSAAGSAAREGLPTAGPAGPDSTGTVPTALGATDGAPGRPDPPATAGVSDRGPSPAAAAAAGPGGSAGLPARGQTRPAPAGSASPGAPTAPGPSAPRATSAAGGTRGATSRPTAPASPTARGDPGAAGTAALGTPQPSGIPGDPGTPAAASPGDTGTRYGNTGTPAAASPGDTGTRYGNTGTRAAATATPGGTTTPSPAPGGPGPGTTVAGAGPGVFVVEDQPPLLRAALLRVPCELVLDMGFVPALGDPASREHRGLLRRFNETISPLFMALPGFLRLEVTSVRRGSVVLAYDALFAAARLPPRAPALAALLNATLEPARARLAVGSAPVLRNVALERPLDPCAELFSCPSGFECVSGADGAARCTSACHRGYCKNQGICAHPRGRQPLCQCPVGSDFWFMGLRCDHRVTQQGLLGMACGVLLSVALVGAVVAGLVIRRFRALLLEAKADQTKSSYRRFCRLDDVSARFWSQPWLASASSLDNPAFSNSEELLQLHVLERGGCGACGGCGCGDGAAGAARPPVPPARAAARPSSRDEWDSSSGSAHEPAADSGKASDVSVCSAAAEPLPWAPLPLRRPRPQEPRRPRSCARGPAAGALERSWTA